MIGIVQAKEKVADQAAKNSKKQQFALQRERIVLPCVWWIFGEGARTIDLQVDVRAMSVVVFRRRNCGRRAPPAEAART
jgi:hypothetical protein